MPKKHAIIGNGPAGMHAIETIRKYQRNDSEIHLVSTEPAYSRMVIPHWMTGAIAEDHVLTADADFYNKYGVTAHKARVCAVDPRLHNISLDDGRTLDFDTLLIATGSSPAKPTIGGVDLPGVHTLWTMEDARAVIPLSGQGKKVVFVGSGFIALTILNAIHKRGCKLRVVELEKHILPRMLDVASANLATQWLNRQGVDVHTGTSVTGIESKGSQLVATLKNGEILDADCLVISTGVNPNIDFLQGSGINISRGVMVDSHLRTNFPDIYAAGDCAEGPNLLGGPPVIHAIQPTAVDHGRVAGANMADQNVEYDGSLSMNVLDICGLQAVCLGRQASNSNSKVMQKESGFIYRRLNFDDDKIIGAIILSPTSDVFMLNDIGMIKGFIQAQLPLGDWKGYLDEHPIDICQPYIACGVAAKLQQKNILPDATEDIGYRYQNIRPNSKADKGPYHAAFAQTWSDTYG